MDKNKVKIVTLEELRKIDPSHINSMTFTDGSVVMVNSDEEGDGNKAGQISNDLFDKDEKQPDIQNDVNMNINFEDEEDEQENGINKVSKNNFTNEYIIPSQNNYNKSNYSNLRTNEKNNLNSNQNSNYNNINQKILIPNNKNITQQRNSFIPIQQSKISNNYTNQIYTNNYNNISIYQSNYSSISSNRNQPGNYQYNNNIRNAQYKPVNTEHSHFLRRYYSNQGSNYNNCPYCRFEAKNKY